MKDLKKLDTVQFFIDSLIYLFFCHKEEPASFLNMMLKWFQWCFEEF